MAEVDTKQRYPQSTPGGEPIPFEIVRPLGLIIQAFTAVAANDVVIPEGADFLILRANYPCLVQLGGDVAIPANGVHTVDLVFVDADDIVVIDHNAATSFGVIRFSANDGVLVVQTCTKYADIRKSAQIDRM